MLRGLYGFGLALLLAFMTACGSGLSSGTKTSPGNFNFSGGSTPQHVVVVVFENQNYGDVVGSSFMPYWNSLANSASLATQFYADVHPSLGNYLMMTAGQDPTVGSPDPDNWMGTISGANIASVLTSAGKSWKVYAQAIPSAGYTGEDNYPYVKHHNPFVYFDSVLNDKSQLANVVDFSQFSSDVSAGSLPSYSFVVPDDVHNGHDCPNGGQLCLPSDHLKAVDSFLQNDIGPLFNNSSVMANTVVIITFDEAATDSTNGGGHIPVIIAGGPIKTKYQSSSTYQFQSLLRFSLQSIGVTNYPGGASSAAPMTEFLK